MAEDRYESGGTTSTAITFLLIGLGAGTVIGMLLAPKPGKQMRRDLRRGPGARNKPAPEAGWRALAAR
jgi:gas vesicle protein